MSAGSGRNKIEIDIAEEWIERIGKTANKICDDSDNNRIKLDHSRCVDSSHRLRLDEHVRISLDVICCTIFNKTVTVLGTRKITVDNFYFHCLPIRVKL
jgi:hypothetical protein